MLYIDNKSFQGLHYPSDAKDKVIIVVSGSDGGIKWAAKIAESFSACGVSSFALSYWKTKNTSKTLSLIPIEIVQAAVCWLKDEGYKKVGIYGLSKGAEFALAAGSYLPQIEFVI
ncbi:MAG: hypothetical protein LBS21_14840, partial [Clostridiales bacterium]|nr:hypothetical protein [Clostridiales bacterium]